MNTKDKHILVLAMSDLYRFKENWYQFAPQKEHQSEKFCGVGQMEVIPQFIEKYIHEKITHILILETSVTNKHLKDDYVQELKKLIDTSETQLISFEDEKKEREFYDEVTAVSFFKKRMEYLNINPEYKDIPFDENQPSEGLEELLNWIRILYRECEEEGGDWKLWLDAHGGFREISLALSTFMQMLSTTDMSGYPKLLDAQKVISADAVYSVQFNNDSAWDNPSEITDKTHFYNDFATSGLKAYMNYGQYLQAALSPIDSKDEEYAFISYKHEEADKERLMFMSMLKKGNYRYWYDDGIHFGSDWVDELEERKCSEMNVLFIALISKGYLTSPQCLKELKDAIHMGKKTILVSLDDTPLYMNNGIVAERNGMRVEISKEELDILTRIQHINLKCYILNDVLQESRLLEKLKKTAYAEMDMIHQRPIIPVHAGDKQDITNCFVNLSNHPSETWDSRQRAAAEVFGPIVDIPFPNVKPDTDEEEINNMAQSLIGQILSYQPKAVMCQGEFTLCNTIVRQLQLAEVDVYSACSDRIATEYTDETGKTVKNSVFDFVQFRKYPKI